MRNGETLIGWAVAIAGFTALVFVVLRLADYLASRLAALPF